VTSLASVSVWSLFRLGADDRQQCKAEVAYFRQQTMQGSLIPNGTHQQGCAIIFVSDAKVIEAIGPTIVEAFLYSNLIDIGHFQSSWYHTRGTRGTTKGRKRGSYFRRVSRAALTHVLPISVAVIEGRLQYNTNGVEIFARRVRR
jgi:hypothetical protein